MGTNIDNVLDDLEQAIEHLEYFATVNSFKLDKTKLDSIVAELVELAKQIDRSK